MYKLYQKFAKKKNIFKTSKVLGEQDDTHLLKKAGELFVESPDLRACQAAGPG